MPDISLTTFVDYVAKSGSPKLTVVKNAKKDVGNYHPAKDFWKHLRNRIIEYHNSSIAEKDYLDGALSEVIDKNRLNNYPKAIEQYKSFIGNKQVTWFEPPRTEWQANDLIVKINPELGLEWDGKKRIIKLYFKKETLSKSKADLITSLLFNSLSENAKNTEFCILDVQGKKLYTHSINSVDLAPLLIAEGIGFASIWPNV